MSDFQTPEPISEDQEQELIRYILGELSPQECERLEHYISEHPELSDYINQLQEVMGLLGNAHPIIKAPERLRERILQGANSSSSQPKTSKIFVFSVGKLVISTLALLFIWLSWDNYRLRQDLALSQVTPRLVQLESNSGLSPSQGRVLIDFHTRRVMMAFQNLAPLPKGKYYQLWAITDDESIACGNFEVHSPDSVLEVVTAPVEEYAHDLFTLKLTIEHSPNPLAPSPEVVMVSQNN